MAHIKKGEVNKVDEVRNVLNELKANALMVLVAIWALASMDAAVAATAGVCLLVVTMLLDGMNAAKETLTALGVGAVGFYVFGWLGAAVAGVPALAAAVSGLGLAFMVYLVLGCLKKVLS